MAGVDTVTIFFGDLHISTNVTTAQGKRAVGTRISQEVFDVVLVQGKDYVGRAFVVNDWFIEMAETDPRREDLKLIQDEAMRCKKIVADLLNFARQQEVQVQETDVNALLEQVLTTMSPEPNFGNLTVLKHFDPELPSIQADPAQVQQVFINLIRNSIEAMPGGGTLTLATRLLDGQQVEIQVSDTGSGISAENLGKLFTPFYTTKPVGMGAGLGLSIAYGIIKMHQGQIAV